MINDLRWVVLLLALAIGGAIWIYVANLRRAQAKADVAVDNEEIKEADATSKLKHATESDQQATDDLRARMRGAPPPGSREG